MTRQEWYRQYRAARAAHSAINMSHVRDESTNKDAWNLIWGGLYANLPPEIYYATVNRFLPRDRLHCIPWPLTSRAAISCNVELLRNSYPHPSRSL